MAINFLTRPKHRPIAAGNGDQYVNLTEAVAVSECADSEFEMPADLVLIAIGFVHPAHDDVVAALGLKTDARGNLAGKVFETSRPGVYSAGDARVGQSLIVTAIADGRRCARAVDRKLRELSPR